MPITDYGIKKFYKGPVEIIFYEKRGNPRERRVKREFDNYFAAEAHCNPPKPALDLPLIERVFGGQPSILRSRNGGHRLGTVMPKPKDISEKV